VWVQNGPEAISRCSTERFDLIMMDLNMPLMDGFATTALIRQAESTHSRVPIIALTAHDANSYRNSCHDAGMDGIMSKPYSLQQCAELVRHWVLRAPGPPDQAAVPDRGAPAVASSSTVEELACVDATAVAGLQSLRGARRADLYSELVDLFQAASREAVAHLQSALEANDLAAASGVCHKFASSAANVGALVFARDLRLLDELCEQGDIARARRLCDRLVAALPTLIGELGRRQNRASA
jgi:CheY-like chemotaxis protein